MPGRSGTPAFIAPLKSEGTLLIFVHANLMSENGLVAAVVATTELGELTILVHVFVEISDVHSSIAVFVRAIDPAFRTDLSVSFSFPVHSTAVSASVSGPSVTRGLVCVQGSSVIHFVAVFAVQARFSANIDVTGHA